MPFRMLSQIRCQKKSRLSVEETPRMSTMTLISVSLTRMHIWNWTNWTSCRSSLLSFHKAKASITIPWTRAASSHLWTWNTIELSLIRGKWKFPLNNIQRRKKSRSLKKSWDSIPNCNLCSSPRWWWPKTPTEAGLTSRFFPKWSRNLAKSKKWQKA